MSHDLLHEQHVNSALEHYRAFAIAVRREWQAADRRCDGWIKAGCGWTTGGFEENSMHERDLLREMLEKGSEDTIKPLAALMSEGLGNDLLKFWRNLTIKIEPNHPRANPRAYWRAKWEDEMEKLDTRMQVSLRRVAPTAPNPPTAGAGIGSSAGVTPAEFARSSDIPKGTIDGAWKRGKITTAPDGKMDVQSVLKWAADYRNRQDDAEPKEGDAGIEQRMAEARTRKQLGGG